MEGSNTNRRLSDLEAILGEYMAQNALAARREAASQAQRDKEMKEFKDEMRAFKDEMKEFKDEMKEFKNEMKEFKDEMKEFKDEMQDFKDEMKEFKEKTNEAIISLKESSEDLKRSVKELNKKWGELSNKLGTIVEDIVAPNLPTIADKYFGLKKIDRLLLNVYVSSQKPEVIGREFDAILVSGDAVLLNETKATVRQNYMEDFIAMLPEFFDYFPEYNGKKLIPIFSSLSLNPAQTAFLTKRGIYATAMTGDTMDILNFNDVVRL